MNADSDDNAETGPKSEESGVPSGSSSFEQLQHQRTPGLLAEFWQFLRYNKKWWLTPILLTLAALGLLVALTATGAAPFIYPF